MNRPTNSNNHQYILPVSCGKWRRKYLNIEKHENIASTQRPAAVMTTGFALQIHPSGNLINGLIANIHSATLAHNEVSLGERAASSILARGV